MIGVVIRWDGMFEAARLLGGCRSTGSGASCNRSLREAREAREAPSVPFAGREPGSLGRARARLAGLPARAPQGHWAIGRARAGQGSQAEGGPSPPPGSRAAEGHPLICAPSSRRLPRVRFDDGKGERGAALGQTAAEGAYAGPCSAADGRRPSPAAGFHVPFLASALQPLGGPLGPCLSAGRGFQYPPNSSLAPPPPFVDAGLPRGYEAARPCQVTSLLALLPHLIALPCQTRAERAKAPSPVPRSISWQSFESNCDCSDLRASEAIVVPTYQICPVLLCKALSCSTLGPALEPLPCPGLALACSLSHTHTPTPSSLLTDLVSRLPSLYPRPDHP